MNLPFEVNRTIVIDAERDTVFSFFTDPERWAAWWGAGSTVDPRVGGKILIRHGNGFESVGEVLEIAAPEKFVFTMSMQLDRIIPPEESRVTMTLDARGKSTAVTVTHDVADEKLSKALPQGWRYHLSLFSNAVANVVNADAAKIVDQWFAIWAQPSEEAVRAICHEDVRYRDRFSSLEGVDDLVAQAQAVQRFMPGFIMERQGEVRHCQGTVLADWSAKNAAGTNVFSLVAGKIAAVTSVTK
jgi:uncharacterized protein YndB with AHSA1/START domain